MIVGALTGLKALLERFLILFRNAEPGFALDFADLTEQKLAWRRNLFLETEFRNGNGDIPQRITSFQVVRGVSDMPGFTSACSVVADSVNMSYAVRPSVHIIGRLYTISAFFKMSDGLAPTLGGFYAESAADFALVINNAAIPPTSLVVQSMGSGVYRVSGSAISTTSVSSTSGVYKYAGNSSKAFRFTGWQLELGPLTAYQKITDVTTEFMAAFPQHLLFQDNKGQLPLHSLEQTCGYALDARYQGARSTTNKILNGTFNTDLTSWVLGAGGGASGGSITWVSGKMRVTNANLTGYQFGQQTFSGLTIGSTYEIEAWASVVAGTPTTNRITIVGGLDFDVTGVPNYIRGIFVAFQTSHVLALGCQQTGSSVAVVTDWDTVSVREISGKHAVAANVAQRPPVGGRVNLLLNTEAALPWGNNNTPNVITANSFGAYNGVRLYMNSVAGDFPHFTGVSGSISAGQTVTASVMVNIATMSGTTFSFLLYAGDADGAQRASFSIVAPWTTPVVATPTANVSNVSATFTLQSTGIYLATITATYAKAASPVLYPYVSAGTAPLAITVGCPQLQVGPYTRYQRVETALFYDTNGFVRGAKFNGTTHYFSVAGVDFTGVNKLIAFASVRKESDTARGTIIGTGTLAAGTFALEGPSAGLNNFLMRMGVNNANSVKTTVGPQTSVLVGYASLNEGVTLYVDGVAQTTNVNNETDNFINTTIWVGAFNGSLFYTGLIARAGVRATASNTILNSYAQRWAGYTPPLL